MHLDELSFPSRDSLLDFRYDGLSPPPPLLEPSLLDRERQVGGRSREGSGSRLVFRRPVGGVTSGRVSFVHVTLPKDGVDVNVFPEPKEEVADLDDLRGEGTPTSDGETSRETTDEPIVTRTGI